MPRPRLQTLRRERWLVWILLTAIGWSYFRNSQHDHKARPLILMNLFNVYGKPDYPYSFMVNATVIGEHNNFYCFTQQGFTFCNNSLCFCQALFEHFKVFSRYYRIITCRVAVRNDMALT